MSSSTRFDVVTFWILAFSRGRAQSAEADGARARNRTGFFKQDDFFEYDYEQEHEHEKVSENMN